MNDVLDFSINLAHEVGELLQKYYDPAGVPAVPKPDRTVVTEADLAADRLISESIARHFPGDGIISEESSHFAPAAHSVVWVIDPLDGTTNFSLGLAIWGISIARLVDGFPELGVIYFPRLAELYTALRGSGAYLNENTIHVRAPDPSQPMSFFACCSRSFRKFDISIPYKPRILGSSAYSFCMVARGTALLGLDSTPKIWDLAAIWVLVEEAGGIIQPLDGPQFFPVSAGIDYSEQSTPVLAAATPALLAMGKSKIHSK